MLLPSLCKAGLSRRLRPLCAFMRDVTRVLLPLSPYIFYFTQSDISDTIAAGIICGEASFRLSFYLIDLCEINTFICCYQT